MYTGLCWLLYIIKTLIIINLMLVYIEFKITILRGMNVMRTIMVDKFENFRDHILNGLGKLVDLLVGVSTNRGIAVAILMVVAVQIAMLVFVVVAPIKVLVASLVMYVALAIYGYNPDITVEPDRDGICDALRDIANRVKKK